MSYTWELSYTNNDLTIVRGKFPVVYGAAEVAQRVLVTLQHYWQEYFLNVPGGVPWYELILGSKDIRQPEAILRQIVLGVPGVNGIVDFKVTFANRALSISLKVEAQNTLIGLTLTTNGVTFEGATVIF